MDRRYRIEQVEVSNFAGIVSASFTANELLQEIVGPNGSGKSSIFEAIRHGLHGSDKRRIPMPVRLGEQTAEIRVTLRANDGSQLFVRRWWTAPDKTYVEIRNEDGAKLDIKLKKLLPTLFNDARKFLSADPMPQREALLKACGADQELIARLDTVKSDALAAKRQEDDRHTFLSEQMHRLPSPDGPVPDELVQLSDLTERLEEATRNDTARINAEGEVRRLTAELEALPEKQARRRDEVHGQWQARKSECAMLEDEIADLQKKKEAVERRAAELQAMYRNHDGLSADERVAKATEVAEAQKALEEVTPSSDVESARKAISTAESMNERFRQRQARREKVREIEASASLVESHRAAAKKADDDKAEHLRSLEMPVDGMEVREDGVYLHGVPFKQVNYAERLRLALVIAMSEETTIPVILLEEANTLGDEVLGRIMKWAAARGWQLFVEKIKTNNIDDAVLVRKGKASKK